MLWCGAQSLTGPSWHAYFILVNILQSFSSFITQLFFIHGTTEYRFSSCLNVCVTYFSQDIIETDGTPWKKRQKKSLLNSSTAFGHVEERGKSPVLPFYVHSKNCGYDRITITARCTTQSVHFAWRNAEIPTNTCIFIWTNESHSIFWSVSGRWAYRDRRVGLRMP